MAIDQNVDVDGLDISGLHQGVQANDRQRHAISAAEFKRRACGRCDGNAADQRYFVVDRLIAVQDDAVVLVSSPRVDFGG
jgi:hypothetical protein